MYDIAFAYTENVFFTGDAGTGKSLLTQAMVTALQKQLGKEHVFVTASTGIAATNIDGVTIHSFAGMKSVDINPSYIYKQILNQHSKGVIDHWMKCKVLIIDEISMIDGRFFDTLECKARRMKKDNHPFGGIQVIVCGHSLYSQ